MTGLGIGLRLGRQRRHESGDSNPALSISGTPVTTATEDSAYTGFTVSASGGDTPYTYSLVGTWPTGITVDSSSGAVSGTPTESGTFTGLSVRVTDGATNTADLDTFSLTVDAAATGTFSLLTDTSAHSVPSISKPAAYTPYTDSTFGTTVERVTGDPGSAMGSTGFVWGTNVHHQYAKLQAWNCDQSMIYIETNSGGSGPGGRTFIEGDHPFGVLYRHSTPASMDEARWSATDPDKMYYVTTGSELRSWVISTNTTALVHTFTGYTGLTFGVHEGMPSHNGDMVVITATRTSDSHMVCFAYRFSDDLKFPDIDLTAVLATATDGMQTISPTGRYVLTYFDDETQRVWDVNGNPIVTFSGTEMPSHAGQGIDHLGYDVTVGSASGSGGDVIKRRLWDGAQTTLNSLSFAYHSSSCNKQGYWSCTDYWDDSGSPYVDEIVISAHDGSGVYRICHMHNTRIDYDSEPHASISPDGKRIIFVSDWEDADDGRPTSVYVADFRDADNLPDIAPAHRETEVQWKLKPNATTTTPSMTFPFAATAGNLLVVFLAIDKSVATISTPTGWTKAQEVVSGTGVSGALFYKIAAGGETSISFTIATSRVTNIAFMEFSGIASSSPLDISAKTDGNAATARTITAGAMTTTNADDLILAFWANDSAASVASATGRGFVDGASGAMETLMSHFADAHNGGDVNTSGAPAVCVARKRRTTTGSESATFSYTGGSADENIAFLAAFKLA